MDSVLQRQSAINESVIDPAAASLKRSNSSILNSLSNAIDEPFIIHPGAISSILHLLTAVTSEQNEHVNLKSIEITNDKFRFFSRLFLKIFILFYRKRMLISACFSFDAYNSYKNEVHATVTFDNSFFEREKNKVVKFYCASIIERF